MYLKGVDVIKVSEEMPNDDKTYLFLDSTNGVSAVYADRSMKGFLEAFGYDLWIKPSDYNYGTNN